MTPTPDIVPVIDTLRFRGLVIEADLGAPLTAPPARSRVHPSAVLGSLAAWSCRYSLPVWFASDPRIAARLVGRLLALAHKELEAAETGPRPPRARLAGVISPALRPRLHPTRSPAENRPGSLQESELSPDATSKRPHTPTRRTAHPSPERSGLGRTR